MKKIITFLLSVILTMNYVNLAANTYIYSENEQKPYTTTRSGDELCNFKFVLEESDGFGWFPSANIGITVDGVDYGLVRLAWGSAYAEEIVPLPSGEVQLSWFGSFAISYHFEVYNSSDELIYTSSYPLFGGLFLTYQNECIECLPITDFEGVYNVEEHQVSLSWKAPESENLTGFDIYRNDILIDSLLPPSTTSYSDNTANLEDGDYKYCVVPVYPSVCSLDEECFETYISNVGITNYKDNILIYPNPARDIVNISGADIANIKFFNNMGRLILNEYNTNEINVSQLTNGIYILSIDVSTGQIIQKKIIINH